MYKTHYGQKIFAKIMKKDTIFIKTVTNINHSPTGIFVDIFPIEILSDNRFMRSLNLFFANIFTIIILAITGYQLSSTFEGKVVSLPNKYDTYLKNLYGNYMELPPIKHRKSIKL